MDNMEKDVSVEQTRPEVKQALTKPDSFRKPYHFEVNENRVERMVSVILTEQANCLTVLGRLDEAAEKYDEAIERSKKLKDYRQVAVGKGQLATVHLLQKKYAEALAGHKEALAIFEKQDEPKSVATAWHQIGRVHQEAGDYESAEAAYRRSLEIETQNNDQVGQATSLRQLGSLYGDDLYRLEEAIIFYRQAADVFVELGDIRSEGITRSNIANTLAQLKRYDEARAEIMRAVECYKPFGTAVELWKTFDILRQIEEATGNPNAARAAWVQARDAYLAYRRQGGYANQGHASFFEHVIGFISQQKINELQAYFNELASKPNTSDSLKQLMQVIVIILNGSRDRALGDDPALNYADAAEMLFLIERLG